MKTTPYSKKAHYEHHRQRPPSQFDPGTFRIVPASHAPDDRGKKFQEKPGAKVVVGKLKDSGKNATQSVLVPKDKNTIE